MVNTLYTRHDRHLNATKKISLTMSNCLISNQIVYIIFKPIHLKYEQLIKHLDLRDLLVSANSQIKNSRKICRRKKKD